MFHDPSPSLGVVPEVEFEVGQRWQNDSGTYEVLAVDGTRACVAGPGECHWVLISSLRRWVLLDGAVIVGH